MPSSFPARERIYRDSPASFPLLRSVKGSYPINFFLKIEIFKGKPRFGMVCPLVIFGVQIESMDILFIGKVDTSLSDLEMALRGMGHKTHRADVSSDGETWDAIVLDPAADQNDPAIAWAQQQGLAVQSLAEFLYRLSKEKTRVVIGGWPGRDRILSMILHVLHYN